MGVPIRDAADDLQDDEKRSEKNVMTWSFVLEYTEFAGASLEMQYAGIGESQLIGPQA